MQFIESLNFETYFKPSLCQLSKQSNSKCMFNIQHVKFMRGVAPLSPTIITCTQKIDLFINLSLMSENTLLKTGIKFSFSKH